MQLMSVVSPERYQKELMDVHNAGALEVFLGADQQCYSIRVVARGKTKFGFYWLVVTLGVAAPPILLYITWRKVLAVLQHVKVTKGGPAVMWACIAWMPLANLYLAAKLIISISQKKWQGDNNNAFFVGVPFAFVCLSIAAVIQSGMALPGLPNIGVLKSAVVRRVIKLHIWSHFNIFLAGMLAKSFVVALLVGTNPFLYGSALLAIVLAASLPILLTAALFTIGQVFMGDPEFRLTWREAVWQAGRLLLVATSCAGVALFLGSICFLLLLSKGGNKVQSVSGVASFFMSHVVLTALPLLMHSLVRFIRNIHS